MTPLECHVNATPIGFIPVMVGNLPGYQLAWGLSSQQIRQVFKAWSDTVAWPSWLTDTKPSHREIRAKNAAHKRYAGPSRTQDVGKVNRWKRT